MIKPEDIPDDENGDVLRRMRSNGDSLTLPRPINFSVVFPSEQAALAFCETIGGSGSRLTLDERGAREELPWEVTVTLEMVPHHAEISAMEERLAFEAAALGGENDGWGCFNMGDLPKT